MSDRQSYTVAQLAQRWSVTQHRVLRYIADGSLRALDVSERPGVGRPRWRILAADVAEWEARRTHRPDVRPQRRRPGCADPDFIRYFSA